MTCRSCGEPVKESMPFCPACGEPIIASSSPAPSAPAAIPQPAPPAAAPAEPVAHVPTPTPPAPTPPAPPSNPSAPKKRPNPVVITSIIIGVCLALGFFSFLAWSAASGFNTADRPDPVNEPVITPTEPVDTTPQSRPPAILSFSAAPPKFEEGEWSTEVSWEIDGAERATLDVGEDQLVVDQRSGTKTIKFDDATLRLKLIAHGADDAEVTSETSVSRSEDPDPESAPDDSSPQSAGTLPAGWESRTTNTDTGWSERFSRVDNPDVAVFVQYVTSLRRPSGTSQPDHIQKIVYDMHMEKSRSRLINYQSVGIDYQSTFQGISCATWDYTELSPTTNLLRFMRKHVVFFGDQDVPLLVTEVRPNGVTQYDSEIHEVLEFRFVDTD